MAPINLTVNGEGHTVNVSPDTPLLWVLRDSLGLTGTKYCCGIGQCRACTVHIDGSPVPSCSIPVSSAADRQVTTIEGLNGDL
ncbi:MAG: 2Fe-2S iron-sulfur cluster binding domain-containing protein, partial [Gemmatimonadota bacterium]